jgi:hypothetical protein
VQALGLDAPVDAVGKWVKDTYSLDMTDAVAQNYTSQARKELGSGLPPRKPGRKPGRKPLEGTGVGKGLVGGGVGVGNGLVGGGGVTGNGAPIKEAVGLLVGLLGRDGAKKVLCEVVDGM